MSHNEQDFMGAMMRLMRMENYPDLYCRVQRKGKTLYLVIKNVGRHNLYKFRLFRIIGCKREAILKEVVTKEKARLKLLDGESTYDSSILPVGIEFSYVIETREVEFHKRQLFEFEIECQYTYETIYTQRITVTVEEDVFSNYIVSVKCDKPIEKTNEQH